MVFISALKPGTVHKVPVLVKKTSATPYRYDSPNSKKAKLRQKAAEAASYKQSLPYAFHTDVKQKKSKFEDQQIAEAVRQQKAGGKQKNAQEFIFDENKKFDIDHFKELNNSFNDANEDSELKGEKEDIDQMNFDFGTPEKKAEPDATKDQQDDILGDLLDLDFNCKQTAPVTDQIPSRKFNFDFNDNKENLNNFDVFSGPHPSQ